MAAVAPHQAAGLAKRRVPIGRGASRSARRLGLISGKGGVGKTMLAVNLAVEAARAGRRVLLVDADAGLTNADLLLGLVPGFDLDDWAAGRCGAEQLCCTGPHGLSLILAGRGAAARSALRSALGRREDSPLTALFWDYDLILVDLGAGLSENVVALGSACDSLWLVATPEPTSLADAYATVKKVFEKNPRLSPELLVNRHSGSASANRTHQALDRLCERFLERPLSLRGAVPEDAAIGRSVLLQSPAVLSASGSEAARILQLLAEGLIEEQFEPPTEEMRVRRPA